MMGTADTIRDQIRRLAAIPMPSREEHALVSAAARETAIRLARRQGAPDPRAACKAAMSKAAGEASHARAVANKARYAKLRALGTDAVPERHCLNPACGKLLVRRAGEDLCAFRQRVVCDCRCMGAKIKHLTQVRTAREDLALAALVAEPARWFTTDQIAQVAGTPRNAVRHRLDAWVRRWGWVEVQRERGRKSPLWRITAAGLAGIMEARQ